MNLLKMNNPKTNGVAIAAGLVAVGIGIDSFIVDAGAELSNRVLTYLVLGSYILKALGSAWSKDGNKGGTESNKVTDAKLEQLSAPPNTTVSRP